MTLVMTEVNDTKLPINLAGKDDDKDLVGSLCLDESLCKEICNLTDRCIELVKAERRGGSAAFPLAPYVMQKTKKKSVDATVKVYDLPKLNAWRTNAGKCTKCGHRWSCKNRSDNFSVDMYVWKQIMTKIYATWSAEKMWTGTQCHLLGSYLHTASSVAAELSSANIINEHDIPTLVARLQCRLFQPDVCGDARLCGSSTETKTTNI